MAMPNHFITKGKLWLAAGLAGVLVACSSVGGGAPTAEKAQWPTKSDVVAASPFTAEGLAALDAKMKEAVEKGQVAGVSYALIKDGKLAALNVHGAQSLGGPALTENTLFRIRSMSKPITGVAMMQLYEKGEASLQVRIWEGGAFDNSTYVELSGTRATTRTRTTAATTQ